MVWARRYEPLAPIIESLVVRALRFAAFEKTVGFGRNLTNISVKLRLVWQFCEGIPVQVFYKVKEQRAQVFKILLVEEILHNLRCAKPPKNNG